MKVVYTDPRWAIGPDGTLDPARGDIEREVYSDAIELDLGAYQNGRFATEGAPLLERLRGADAVLVLRTVITPDVMDVLAPTCKVIGRQGVGFDNFDLPELARRGIYAFNVPDYCSAEVSDHALALTLALERKIVAQNAAVKAGRWSPTGSGRPRRLGALTFGIVGFGRIGAATARKAAAFYGSVLAFDPFVSADAMAGLGVAKAATLEVLMERSDVVSVHAPLDERTRNLIGRAALARAKDGALLINTARGGLVDPQAVLAALESGRLAGYGSDVFSPEDPNEHPVNRALLAFDNTIVSAHCAFLSNESERSVRRRAAEEIRHVLDAGEPPRFGRLA
ncbi:MAG: C-terminal binding protein [Candidatus Eremiobacteraeota bacterium]|nr:C-terminal binding protein [Candidatus Eremiobacteraeota bacterium]